MFQLSCNLNTDLSLADLRRSGSEQDHQHDGGVGKMPSIAEHLDSDFVLDDLGGCLGIPSLDSRARKCKRIILRLTIAANTNV